MTDLAQETNPIEAEFLAALRCPNCDSCEPLSPGGGGIVCCERCAARFPVEGHIPRFVPPDNYAKNFGFEWNRHSRTQLDEFSGVSISRDRFFHVTGWPMQMPGERILEAGCGAGRFTSVALTTGASVYSFDYSSAVDMNYAQNGQNERLHICQADIYRIPFERDSFDKVFCFGVLQHCPDPRKAFESLALYVRPGGQLAIDIYHAKPRDWINPAVWLRCITKYLPNQALYRVVEKVVPLLLPVKVWMTEKLPLGRYLAFFIPIVSHRGVLPGAEKLTWGQLQDWSILDTFDHYSPCYDNGQRLSTVVRWFEEAGFEAVSVTYGPNGINGRGTKPLA